MPSQKELAQPPLPIEHSIGIRHGEDRTFYEIPSWCRVDLSEMLSQVKKSGQHFIGVLLSNHHVLYSRSVPTHGQMLIKMGYLPEATDNYAQFQYYPPDPQNPQEYDLMIYGNLNGSGNEAEPEELLCFLRNSLP